MKRTRMNSFERLARHLVPAVLAGFAIRAAAAPKQRPIDEATDRSHIARIASDRGSANQAVTPGNGKSRTPPRSAVGQ
jgi:hypothetical protein